jgi:Leucine-rich repeat (LRR) protein
MLSLEYLDLRNNRIAVVQNLTTLKRLTYLNLANNRITRMDPQELPDNLEYLHIKDNPLENPQVSHLKFL